jgi:hypothetical protein
MKINYVFKFVVEFVIICIQIYVALVKLIEFSL